MEESHTTKEEYIMRESWRGEYQEEGPEINGYIHRDRGVKGGVERREEDWTTVQEGRIWEKRSWYQGLYV